MAEMRNNEHLGRGSETFEDTYDPCGMPNGTGSRPSQPLAISNARACPRCGGHAIM